MTEAAIVGLRRDRRLGPARIAGILGLNTSTVHRVLVRHAMPRLSWLDRPTGQLIRRYEKSRPGELVHVDVKKLGRDPPTAAAGARTAATARPPVHATGAGSATSTCTAPSTTTPGLAYAEIHSDETGRDLRRVPAPGPQPGSPPTASTGSRPS